MFTNQIFWNISSNCKYQPVCLINFSFYELHKSRSVERRQGLQVVANSNAILTDCIDLINQCHFCQNQRQYHWSDIEVFLSRYYLWHYYHNTWNIIGKKSFLWWAINEEFETAISICIPGKSTPTNWTVIHLMSVNHKTFRQTLKSKRINNQ